MRTDDGLEFAGGLDRRARCFDEHVFGAQPGRLGNAARAHRDHANAVGVGFDLYAEQGSAPGLRLPGGSGGRPNTAVARPAERWLQSSSASQGRSETTRLIPRLSSWCGTPSPCATCWLPITPTTRASGLRAAARGKCLRHRPVPDELGLHEVAEFRIGARRGGALLLRVLCIRFEQACQIGCARRRRFGHAFALVRRHRRESFRAYRAGETVLDVERHHGNAVQARELEQRQIKGGIVSPHLRPVRCLEKLRLAQFAGDPAVQRGLYPARKHLEAEHEFRVQGRERSHGLQLPAMVVGVVVRFAEQHHLRGRWRARTVPAPRWVRCPAGSTRRPERRLHARARAVRMRRREARPRRGRWRARRLQWTHA